MSTAVNRVAFSFGAVAEASASGDDGVWMKIVPAGVFFGRDGRGPFDAGDRAAMQAIVDRTLRHAAGTEVMVDYDHQSFFGVKDGVGGNAPAAGWMKAFEVRDDGIYARVKWTAAAAEKIKAEEYRYLSPLLVPTKAGKIHRIDNAALINQPALDLAAIAAAATRFTQQEDEAMTLLERLAKALGLDSTVSEDTLVTAVAAFAADRDTIAVAAGLKAGATTDQVVVAMGSLRAGGEPDPKAFVPMGMFKELQGRIATLETSGVAEKAEAAVDKAIADGRIPPANRDWALKSATADLADFEAFVSRQPKLTARQLVPETIKDGDPVLTDADHAAMKATGISREAFLAARKQEAQ